MIEKSETKEVFSPCASTESIQARQSGPVLTSTEHPQKISPSGGQAVKLNGMAATGPQDLQQGSEVVRGARRAALRSGNEADTMVARNNERRKVKDNCIVDMRLLARRQAIFYRRRRNKLASKMVCLVIRYDLRSPSAAGTGITTFRLHPPDMISFRKVQLSAGKTPAAGGVNHPFFLINWKESPASGSFALNALPTVSVYVHFLFCLD